MALRARGAGPAGDRCGETAIFVGRHFIITVRHGSARTHADLRHRLEAFPEGLRLGVDDVRSIFSCRRQLARFARLLQPMPEMSARLQRLDLPCVGAAMRPCFRDVEDHIRRVAGRVEGLRDVLRAVFESGLPLEQRRRSVVTRKLAARAAIPGVPTAIAGIHGVNFESMPELKLRYGYCAVLAVTLTICGPLYARFKRIDWL